MNRFLLSLWLLGAAVFGANVLIILGWPTNEPKIDVGSTEKDPIQPKDGSRPAEDNSMSAGVNDAPAIRLEPKGAVSLASPSHTAQSAMDTRSKATTPHPIAPATAESQAQPSSQALLQSQQQTLSQAQQVYPSQAGGESALIAQGDEWAKVSSSGANVRSGPSSSASHIASLSPGQALRVVSREKGWVQVASRDGSQMGWIYEKLLDPDIASQQQGLAGAAPAAGPGQPQGDAAGQERPQAEMVTVTRPGTKVLSAPSDEAPMLFGFPEGRHLRVLSRESGWVQIVDPESQQAGWIAEDSLGPAVAEQKQRSAAKQRPGRSDSHRRSRTETAESDQGWSLADEEEKFGPANEIIERPMRGRKWGRRGGRFAGGLRRSWRAF